MRRRLPVRNHRAFDFRLRIHCDIEQEVVGVGTRSRLRRRGQRTRRRGGWLVVRSSERGMMRVATHRCGEARARQSNFPPRNHSIPHHPFPFPHPRSIFLSLLLLSINYPLLLFRVFVPLSMFRVPPSHPFSPFTSVFVAFAPRALRLVRAYIYIQHSLSLLFLHFTSFGPVQRRSVYRTVRCASIRTY